MIITHHAVPHAHPGLVMTTRDQGDHLLAAFVHQQLHWWTRTHPRISAAIANTHQTWATVPTKNGGGAATEDQTRMALIVCHLEQRAMHHIVGDHRSRTLLRQQITTARVLSWVYNQIHLHGRELDRICTTRDLWPHRLQPDPPTTHQQ